MIDAPTLQTAGVRPFYERVGDELRINLHRGQTPVIDILRDEWDTVRVIGVGAGWQSGKTLMGPGYLKYCMDRRQSEGRTGTVSEPQDFVAISGTYDLLRLKMLPALQGLFCSWMGWGDYSAGDKVIYSKDKLSRIILRSADSSIGLESFTALDGWFDEAGRDEVCIEAYESIMRGLAVNEGHLLITTTLWNLGWLHQQVYQPAIGGDPRYRWVTFESLDNPAFSRREWDRAKESMPDWKFDMRYRGIYRKPSGLIYQDYDDGLSVLTPVMERILEGDDWRERVARMAIDWRGHLCKPFSIPAHWERIVGVDFGASLHNAQVWVAEEPGTGNYYAYRESCGIAATGPEQAAAAVDYREPVALALGGAPSEDDARREWGEAGFGVAKPWINDVESGIDRVTGLLRMRRLFIFDTLTGLRSELGTYSRELDDAGEPTQKIKDKEKFHRLDALRYLATAIPMERPAGAEADPLDSMELRSKEYILALEEREKPVETDEYLV